MNILDLIVIAIIVISGVRAYYRGFLCTVFQTLSTIIALVLSYMIYKPINVILRKTFLYGWLQKAAMGQIFNQENPTGLQGQTQLINTIKLPIPNNIKENLIRNNNPEVYKLLGVDSFQEYIGGYIANFLLNIIAFIIVWCLVKAILYVADETLQIITMLPVIKFADRWLGLGFGFIKGAIGVWIATIVVAILIVLPKFQQVGVLLSDSSIARWFYENNIVLEIIDQLFV